MKYLGEYKTRLAKTILGQEETIQNLSYFRNQLFYYIILYTIPISPLAIIPGIIASYRTGYANLIALNVLTLLIFIIIGFVKPIKIETRKYIFISTLFLIAWSLFYNLKLEGPGLMYLFAVVIVTCLIHSGRSAYLLILTNSIALTIIGLNIQFDWFSLNIGLNQSLTTWFGIVVNLVFLSTVIVACFEMIFKKLEKIIISQRELNKQVKSDNQKMIDAQNILKEKNDELNQFAHIIAHDLKEPLRSMQAFSDLTIKKYKNSIPEKGQEFLNHIKTSSVRMALLLDSLLEYAQIGTGKQKSTFAVEDILKELENDLSQLIKENKAVISYNHLPQITAYELEFKQLLQNLMANAIKFKKDNDSIKVKIEALEKPEYWEFLITDNGIGIDPKQQQKIFTIFHRLHKDKFPGTGLGLANCKKIVEMHDGKIWVDSEENKGSTFYFTVSKFLGKHTKND